MANFLKSLFVKGVEIDPAGATSAQVLSYNGTKFVPAAAAGGGSSVTVSDTAPVSPTAGDVWYESDTGILFVRYDSYWVEVGGDRGAVGVTGTGDALIANPLSQFAATTSAQLAGVISDKTGSGSLVFGNAPTFTGTVTTPALTVTNATTSGSYLQGTDYLSPYQGFRNKIINGDMRIAQRGAATITGSGSQQFPVDRIAVYDGSGSVTFVQSSTAPAGFAYSLLATVTATDSYTTAGYTEIVQFIESANVSDFAFGTASASPVTISFWVRSSLSGSYNVSIRNNAANRSNRTTFAVAAGEVNTWVKKSVTFAGDTSGTWTNDTTTAFVVIMGLGHGTNYDNTADTWTATNSPSTSGSIDFAANSGATFYLTGLQVERGSVATPFEHRPIGVELALCQRYFQLMNSNMANNDFNIMMVRESATQGQSTIWLPVTMRIYPSIFGTSYGRCVFRDTSFGLVVQLVSSIITNTSGPSSNAVTIVITHVSTSGTYVYSEWDMNPANASLGLSAEL